MFVDPDDYVSPDFINTAVNEMENGDYDIVIFGFWKVEGNKKIKITTKGKYNFKSSDEIRTTLFPSLYAFSNQDLTRFLKGGKLNKNFEPAYLWRCIYKKELIDKNNMFFRGRVGEDTIFNSEIVLYATSIKSIDTPLYFYEPRQEGLYFSTIKGDKILSQKLNQLSERKRIGEIYTSLTKKDYKSLYEGSNFMSCFHLASTLSKENKYKDFKLFVDLPEIKSSIKHSRIKFGNKKMLFPHILLKLGMYRTFFSLFTLLDKMNMHVSIHGSIIKN